MASLYCLIVVCICLCSDVCFGDVIKQSNGKTASNVCNISTFRTQFDIGATKYNPENYENMEAKCMKLKFVDQGSENKYQIYEKLFTVNDFTKILKKAEYEVMPISNFVDLIDFCLSEENESHSVNIAVNNKNYLEISIKYTPDKYTPQVLFVLNIPSKEMNEIDLLKLRLKDIENNFPVLFYEKLTKAKDRSSGWQNINLDYCNDENGDNKFIKHNKQKGSIRLSPGKYIIEAEGTAYFVNRHIIQIISEDNTIKLNGTPQHNHRGGHGGFDTTTSRILKQLINIKKETNLVFRWWFQTGKSDGALYDSSYPQKDLGDAYVAAVTIQRL